MYSNKYIITYKKYSTTYVKVHTTENMCKCLMEVSTTEVPYMHCSLFIASNLLNFLDAKLMYNIRIALYTCPCDISSGTAAGAELLLIMNYNFYIFTYGVFKEQSIKFL